MTDTRHAPPPAPRPIPEYDVSAGPFSHLAAERDRLAALRWRHFDAEQVGTTLGAQISGVDLTRPLAGAVFDELRTALHEYKVLFFRDQPMSADAHAALARQFGPLEVHPLLPANSAESALARFQKDANVSGYENAWHHDVTWRPEPSILAILHAIEVPPIGGDTLFADMYAAYDSLDDETKAEIDRLDAAHDFTYYLRGLVPDEKIAELQAAHPPVTHPVVCTHPITGRRHLYVNRMFVSHIAGYPHDTGRALLDRLCRTADAPEHQVRFRWAPDSVAIWDNRAVQHYAASGYWPHTRIMERASVTGPVPCR
ncbi:TauD/TfdA dioxygenase family protein [Mycolicibacterium smegmatis]|uniref:Alpha-ketoglutarate-dependent taurine dioxygenase n=2 Tax=Mycolicibacterium smegmatis TaxID=1772 RepID=A0QNV9_MYCS2|nr:TauD/TfdA family dioxygenase [Mycolicibacterium smegmatis]ABK72553.1 alpha-ketoglutarate-dependent taurine dioxygenase [Mycolicibacterium smegmatis MC2 155]AIU05462.1 taurine dioxygenase [Mycolicibacterium smegmatis MC2 155]AIU12087.1 taurine dioxygenase [Mycolicibacterium smegmatis]AIU18711.1 taurine dioxygenase [Mycolicibacterium smegmatis]MBE9620939.1 TauD/TfdA family dioxygenase [Mycolicibacterium smegmatis]